MSKNKNNIPKGMKFMGIAILLMFIGPVILSIGFRAQKDGIYVWTVLGGIISLVAIVFAYLGIKTIVKGLFNND